jgi:thiol-disulfide isomerase/thioredoxin
MKFFSSTVLCLSLLVADAHAGTPGEVGVGEILRDARMYGVGGKIKQLSAFRGKPLIINVWASWGAPCRAEMGSLDRLSKLDRKKQFTVIGISTDDDAIAATELVVKSRLGFENFVDDNLLLENMLGANTIPLTLLVDANGRVLKKVRGTKDWASPAMLELVEQTLRIKIER